MWVLRDQVCHLESIPPKRPELCFSESKVEHFLNKRDHSSTYITTICRCWPTSQQRSPLLKESQCPLGRSVSDWKLKKWKSDCFSAGRALLSAGGGLQSQSSKGENINKFTWGMTEFKLFRVICMWSNKNGTFIILLFLSWLKESRLNVL